MTIGSAHKRDNLPLKGFRFHLLQHDDPHGSLSGEEDGVNHHDGTDWDAVVHGSQAHDPPAETEEQKIRTETKHGEEKQKVTA